MSPAPQSQRSFNIHINIFFPFRKLVKILYRKVGNVNKKIKIKALLLHSALWIHFIYYTPTNALLYCNSLKCLH